MSSAAELRQCLSEELGPTVASDEKLLSECVNICQTFGLAGTDLRYKWEALCFGTSQSINILTMDSVAALKAKVQRDKVAEQTKANKTSARAPMPSGLSMSRGKIGPVKFALGKPGLSGTLRVGAPPVKSTLDGGDVRKTGIAGPSKVEFKGPQNSKNKRSYKYMYEKVSQRSEVLDDKIDEFAELVKEHYDLPELGDPGASTEESTTIIGRICIDAESSPRNVKLNEASVILESSRMMGSGVRVPLKFDSNVKIRGGAKGVRGVGLFPGAIVALKGRNGGGGWFSVEEILAIPPLNVSPASLGNDVKPEPGDTSFSMCIASGPFTPDSDLDYKPWHTLLESLKSSKPAVLMLIGPFVDTFHPHIKNGEIDSPPAQIFREHFIRNLRDYLDLSSGSIVLLVPSICDLINNHAVFPQGEFDAGFAGDSRIRLLPNPCRFTLNGISFGVTSVDVLFHLRKEEFIKQGEEIDPVSSTPEQGNDAMSNLCRHLLQQRSFYPIFPVPFDLSSEVNLDISHSDGLRLGADLDEAEEYSPDIVIVPSRLKHFFKVVDNSMFINPSFLSKSTYTTLTLGQKGHGAMKDQIAVDIAKLS